MKKSDSIRIVDMVGVGEIAERAGVTSAAVSNWIKRHDSFPAPIVALKCGQIFSWPQVRAWITRPQIVTRTITRTLKEDGRWNHSRVGAGLTATQLQPRKLGPTRTASSIGNTR